MEPNTLDVFYIHNQLVHIATAKPETKRFAHRKTTFERVEFFARHMFSEKQPRHQNGKAAQSRRENRQC